MKATRTHSPNPIWRTAGLALFLLIFKTTLLPAQTLGVAAKSTIFSEILAAKSNKIILKTDLALLQAGKKKSTTWQDATLTFGKNIEWKVELKPRGKFRRRICEMPPIKIKFSKKALAAAGLDSLRTIKLVTHCADNTGGDALLIREYLAYKMYERVSPIAFRARLVQVTYQDVNDKKLKINRLGILLEDDTELARRTGGSLVEAWNLPTDSLQSNQAAVATMFNYFIGNTDWSIESFRNIKFVRPTGGGKISMVAYDFDFSGFVNAPYASPSTESRLKNVRERFWMGQNLPEDAIREACKTFRKEKKELLQICREAEGLPDEWKQEMVEYVLSFYSLMDEMGDLPKNRPAEPER